MKYAAFERAPAFGAKLVSADLDAAKAVPGVEDVIVMKGGDNPELLIDGVAIIASNWWIANKAREKLAIEWDNGEWARHIERGLRRARRRAARRQARRRSSARPATPTRRSPRPPR